MAQKIVLGKGVASLFTPAMSDLSNIEGFKIQEQTKTESGPMGPLLVDVEQIRPNKNQPRKIFKERELAELADSIRENGIIQPLIVAEIEGGYELIAGERRLRAAKLIGLEKVPVVLKRGTSRDKAVMAIIENIQRADLNCVEEGLAYFELLETYKLTQEELSKKLGKDRSSIANYLRVIRLPREVIELLRKEELSFGHAKILAALTEREKIIRLAREASEKQLSVRDLEKLISKKSSIKEKAPLFGEDKVKQLRETLEQKTGFHYHLKTKKNGSGQIVIKFNNEAEFNDIFEYLVKR